MRLSGVSTYVTGSSAGISAERSAPSGREPRAEAPVTGGAGQAGDTVTISPLARAKADEEKLKREVDQLKRDEVRVKAHEAAHKSAGGQYAGSVSYSYRQGPDGRSYVVGGEVQIDIAPEQTPQQTVSKMQVVIRAATAPADPSGQDRSVAAQAASQMAEAQRQLASKEGEASPSGVTGESSSPPSPAAAPASSNDEHRDRSGSEVQGGVSAARANLSISPRPFSAYA